MSLPTPPEAPQKPAQKQEIQVTFIFTIKRYFFYPLNYDVIDFGKPQGAASPLVGQLVQAFAVMASGISLI